MEGEDKMAKSRKQKNKKIYDELEVELKNNKENVYEEKLKSIDPTLDSKGEVVFEEKKSNIVKRNEQKNNSALTTIAKKVNGEKSNKKNELVVVKKEKKAAKKKEKAEIVEEEFNEPISYTDKLSIEEILRAKLEQQQKLREDKKNMKRSPNDKNYTPEIMQKRIKPHIGVDVRKEAKIKHKDYRWLAMTVLIVALIAIIVIGALLIFKVI